MVIYTNIHRAAGPSGLAALCVGGEGVDCAHCVWADVTARDEHGNVIQVLCLRPSLCKGGSNGCDTEDADTQPIQQGSRDD